jgi:hypothetical protein
VAPAFGRGGTEDEAPAAGIVGQQLGFAGVREVGQAGIRHLEGGVHRGHRGQHLVDAARRGLRWQVDRETEGDLGLGHAHAVAGQRHGAAGLVHEAGQDAPGQRPAHADVRLAGAAGGGDLPADHAVTGHRRQLGLDGQAGGGVGRV